MIAPFHKSCLQMGANSDWLNPVNAGQTKVNIYIGKPLRAVARTIYILVCDSFMPLIGILYHISQSIKHVVILRQEQDSHQRAWSHLKNAFKEVSEVFKFSACCCILLVAHNSIKSKNFLIFMWVVNLTIIVFNKFTINPDSFKTLD